MRPNVVRDRLAAGQAVVNGWLSIGAGYSAEGVGHSAVHSVTVDLQHGMFDTGQAIAMLQALSATPATPLVRVGSNDAAQIMHLLDAGAYGIICPMVSSPEDAAALVAACRYPPTGRRSFGPSRGLLYGGPNYVTLANATVMAIPMIETAEGFERIEEILDVAGIDMLYLGPYDMAFALDGHVGHPRPESEAAMDRVLAAATARDVPVGVFCTSGEEASNRLAQGFRLVTPGNDFGHLTRSLRDAVHVTLAVSADDPDSDRDHGY